MKKNKLPNLLKTGILLFGVSILLWNCQNNITNEEISPEKSIIEYGISKENFLNLKTTKKVAAKVKDSKKNNSSLNKNTAGELTFEELIERLNLENTYYSLTDSTEVLSAPVKTFGNYKRVLFSVTTGEINNSYLLTYPNPQDTKTFYVSNLYGKLLQKVVIQPNGIGKVVSYNSNNTLAKGDFCGDQTVYETCSSGNHSFQNEDTVWECDYWTNLSGGNPPSKFTISGECGGASGGSGGPSNDDTSGNPTNTGGVSTAPSGGGGLPTNLEQECVASLDCEECDLPGDLNRDCTIDEYEGCLMLGYTNEVCECSVNGGNIDECTFDEQVFIDDSFKDNSCLKSVYDKMGKATKFKEYLQNFEPEFSVAHLRFSSSTSLPSNTNAETSAPQNYLISITFNENNLARPRLSIARTMIHEIIHAEIFRKLLSVAQHPSIQLDQNQIIQLKNDYPGLYDYYMRWKWNLPQGQTPSSPQHESMAQHYRGIIKQALKNFDSTQSEQTYNALSWVGLMGSGTFNSSTGLYSNSTQAWINTSLSERLNILNTINNFNTSNPNCQ
ncbi:hypothetical protein [Polaribacter atrinae]|nr:hypothetical protein [Polaribacter atrinae]